MDADAPEEVGVRLFLLGWTALLVAGAVPAVPCRVVLAVGSRSVAPVPVLAVAVLEVAVVSGRDEAAVAGATATPRLRALSPGERKPTSLEARTLMGDFFFAVARLSMSSWIFWASILSSLFFNSGG